MLFIFYLLNLKGRRVDYLYSNQHMKKKIIKIMLAVLFLQDLVYLQIMMYSCLTYEKTVNVYQKNYE